MSKTAQFPKESGKTGTFERQRSVFRDWVRDDASADFPAEAGRYHLYVSLACPWAHRVILGRVLLGLEDAIGLTVVDPIREARGWRFTGEGDPVNGFRFLREAYLATDPTFEGRVTVPTLWDTQTGQVVNNESSEILRMLNGAFRRFGHGREDWYPEALRAEIDAVNEDVYSQINNGVYRAGFATRQEAYEEAYEALFGALDRLEARLEGQRYLVGGQRTEADWRLFTTLIRFDAVYHGHFKCNHKRLVDYPNLWGYVRDLYQVPGVAETVNFDHIQRHYYVTHDSINPTQIVPKGPSLDLWAAHGRERLA